MEHRGPDDGGYFGQISFGMGMRRLAIIDPEHGRQPVASPGGRFVIVLNGEIYNYIELRAELRRKGYTFKTLCDTEVLACVIEEYGMQGVNLLNGMFAFAAWDKAEHTLYLCRDRLGVKPLFYSQNEANLVFSSDLNALAGAADPGEVDEEAFLAYLGLAYIPYPETIFSNIRKLEPATYLKINSESGVESKCYWHLRRDVDNLSRTLDSYSEELTELLHSAVQYQVRSDVPVGAFLSGGLDSASIIALMHEKIREPINTFSLGFEDGLNELSDARTLSQRFGTRHREVFLRTEEISGLLNEAVDYLDEPIYDNAIIPTFVLSRLAKQHGVKVVLNGTGGDEIFGGYHRYEFKSKVALLLRMPERIRSIAGRLVSCFSGERGGRIRRPETLFLASGIDFSFLGNVFREVSYADRVRDRASRHVRTLVTQLQNRNELMEYDLRSYLVDDVLSLLDKMTMAHSVEGRVPLLDHRVVEFLFRIPVDIKMKNGERKRLLKYTMRAHLPAHILGLPKRGFSGPTMSWVDGVLKEEIRDHLLASPIDFLRRRLHPARLEKVLEGSKPNAYEAESIFALFMFSKWYRSVAEGRKRSAYDDRIPTMDLHR